MNNFDDDVANGAINTSKEIKKDAEVYTFGMFSLTDPSITGHVGSGSWSDAEKFNAYMMEFLVITQMPKVIKT